jgi:hypothetical protein
MRQPPRAQEKEPKSSSWSNWTAVRARPQGAHASERPGFAGKGKRVVPMAKRRIDVELPAPVLGALMRLAAPASAVPRPVRAGAREVDLDTAARAGAVADTPRIRAFGWCAVDAFDGACVPRRRRRLRTTDGAPLARLPSIRRAFRTGRPAFSRLAAPTVCPRLVAPITPAVASNHEQGGHGHHR